MIFRFVKFPTGFPLIIIISIIILSAFRCSMRDGDILGMREPQPHPTGLIMHDSVWNEFDFIDSTGSIRCTIATDFQIYTIKYGDYPDSLKDSYTNSSPRLTLIGVKINQPFFYQIKITTMTGDTFSDTGVILTPTGIPPHKPINLNVIPDYSGALLQWQASSSASEYVVYRKEDQTAIFEMIAVTAKTSYHDSLNSFSKYIYTVTARNKFGETRSNIQLTGYKIINLAPPTSLVASKGSLYRQIGLSWIPNPSATSVGVLRSGSANGPYSEIASGITGNSYIDSVGGNSFYFYKVSSLDQDKHTGPASVYDSGFCRYFLNPPVISDISEGAYENKIYIYWYPVNKAMEYRIYRSEKANGEYIPVATVSDTFFVDYVNSTRKYFYEISTISPDSQEGQRSPLIIGYVKDIEPPDNLIVEDDSRSCIPLKWDSVLSAAYYKIYRFSKIDSQAVFIDSTEKNSYCDQVLPGRVWQYMVTLVSNKLVESRFSNAVIAESHGIREPEKLVASQGSSQLFVTLSWPPVPGAIGYHLYRSTSTSSSVLISSKIIDTVYIDSSASDTNFYRVCAVDSTGAEGFFSGIASGFPAPLDIVSNLRGSLDIPHVLQISWDAAINAEKYLIYRSAVAPAGPYIPVDTVNEPVYVDSSRISAYYQVAAMYRSRIGKPTESVFAKKLEAPSNFGLSAEKNFLQLTWNKTMGAVSYSIYKSTDSGAYTWINNVHDNYYNDSAVSSGLYSYKLTSVSANGETPKSATASMKYKKGVENFTVMAAGDTVKLRWSKVASVSDYMIYVTNNSGFDNNYKVSADTVTYFTYTQSDTYYFRIKPVLTGYTFPFSDTKSGYALAKPDRPTLNSIQNKIGYVNLTFKPSSTGEQPTGYVVFRSTSSGTGYIPVDTVNELFYNDTPPSVNITYYYKVGAINSSGVGDLSNNLSGKSLPLPAPVNLTASNNLYGTHIALSWPRVNDADKYIIYRADGPYSTISVYDTCSDTFYNDSAATAHSQFYYAIASMKGSETSGLSVQRIGTVLPPPSYAEVDDTNYLYIGMHWGKSSGASKTYIYRSVLESGPFSKIDSTSDTLYSDYVTENKTYYYKFSSGNLNESVLSSFTVSAHLDKPKYPALVRASEGLREDTILVSWFKGTGAKQYGVYRSTNSSFTSPVLVKTTSDTFVYDPVSSGTFYYYRVKSINTAGESVFSTSMASGYSIPASVPEPPSVLQSAHTADYIRLSWTSPDFQATPFLGFVIYRAEETEGIISEFSVLDTTVDDEYYDHAEKSYPTQYWYYVKTYNLRGESTPSETVFNSRQ